MSKTALGTALIIGVFAFTLLGAQIKLGESIVIGEPFAVEVEADDTLVVLNLSNPTRVYEFPVTKGEKIQLCFVRPCDPPCPKVPDVPAERVIQANPGDEILFVLKKNPQASEVRRLVKRSSPGTEPSVEAKLGVTDKGCHLWVTVKYDAEDRSCEPDELFVEVFVVDEQDPIKLKLMEEGPAKGKFVGSCPLSLEYSSSKGKFVVTYTPDSPQTPSEKKQKTKEVALPNYPTFSVSVKGKKYEFKLIEPITTQVLNAIPEKFRKDGCSLAYLTGLIQPLVAPSHEISIGEIQGKLYIVVKRGECQYLAGVKDVTILDSVKLVVKDEKGNVLTGGYLTRGQKYTVVAENGLSEGCIMVVALGPGDKGCSAIVTKPGNTLEWTPAPEHEGKRIAIIYVDPYFCNPPALIFTVD